MIHAIHVIGCNAAADSSMDRLQQPTHLQHALFKLSCYNSMSAQHYNCTGCRQCRPGERSSVATAATVAPTMAPTTPSAAPATTAPTADSAAMPPPAEGSETPAETPADAPPPLFGALPLPPPPPADGSATQAPAAATAAPTAGPQLKVAGEWAQCGEHPAQLRKCFNN